MKKSITVFIAANVLITCFLFSNIVFAQPGALDLSFSGDGKTLTNVYSSQFERSNSVAIQNDGKILVGGLVSGTYSKFALARYNNDGSLDNSFGTSGTVQTDVGVLYANSGANAITIQSDGKILVAGYCVGVGNSDDFALLRYNSNGTLDNTFGSGGITTTNIGASSTADVANAITLQSDGKIILVGRSFNGSDNDFVVVRYNSNGALDNTFDADGKVITNFGVYHDVAYSVTIQSDGKILVVGSASDASGTRFGSARYNINGSLDNTFDADGKLTTTLADQDIGHSVKIQTDGKIVIAGCSFNGLGQWDFSICRLNTNGVLDNTFGTGGKVVTPTNLYNADQPMQMAIDNNGKILIVGSNQSGTLKSISLNRYNTNGSLDVTFDFDGKVFTDFGFDTFGHSIALQNDGKIVVTGYSGGWDAQFAVARYNSICVSTSNNIQQTACNSYTLNSQTYTTSGVYNQLLTNSVGCDSIITLDLTIYFPNAGSETITACDAYTWAANGTIYTSSGTYTALLTNMYGCDSTATLNLTINNSNAGSQNVTACNSYTWIANGTNYTTGGIYTALLTNMNGCDSTATLNLTIHNSNAGSQNVTACNSFLWTANGTTYTTGGIYTALLTNMYGCDSTATLNLTIHNSNSGSETITSCDSYFWSANGTTYTAGGVYAAVLTNMNGCDSTATLNLTINSVDNSINTMGDISLEANTSTAQYQWLDCDDSYSPIMNETNQLFVASSNGNYAVEVSENGCVDTSACLLIYSVGMNEINTSSALIYPNPTVDFVTIQLGSNTYHTIQIMDTWGRIVKIVNVNSNEVELDLQKMERGVYYLKLIADNSTMIEKVVKE